jgi:soluble lytic murein transglycosylase-like protein
MKHLAILTGSLLCLVLVARTVPAQEEGSPAAGPCRVDPDRLWFVTEAAADIAGVDPDLLSSIAWVESHDCDRAVSPAGAAGLMQLMPETAAEFGVNDRFDPAQSVLGGAKFLADLERSANGYRSLTLAEILAAYNAGAGAVERYGGVPPYEETRAYVRDVLMLYLLGDKTPHPLPRIVTRPQVARTRAPRLSGDAEIFAQLGNIRGARAEAVSAPSP